MPPKNKGKKAKKQNDDDFWETAGEAVAGNNAAAPIEVAADDDDDDYQPTKKAAGFSGLASLGLDHGIEEDDDEDGGGLMGAIKASTNKDKKKDKKKKKGGATAVAFEDGPPPGEGSDGEAAAAKGDISAPSKPVQMTAEELADEEFGPVKQKGGKKDKPAPVVADEAEEGEEAGEVKILSKKEKEKLKKEKEKAKKKAQAAAKKEAVAAEAPAATPAPAPSEPQEAPPAPSGAADDDGDEEETAPGTSANAKKKKKKKAAKKEDPEPAPAPTKKKGGMSALKAMMEEKRRLEEEARAREEEERHRIEEEERRLAEEEKKKEEERLRRKEKEKTKRDLARKEGRLLTKKQKEEKAAAEIRRKALLESGVVVAGLADGSGSVPGAGKKVNYGAKKKKGPPQQQQQPPAAKEPTPAPSVSSPTTSPVPTEKTLKTETAVTTPDEKEGDVKSEWDASTADEAEKPPETPDVKSDWDASSSEDEAPAKANGKSESATKASTGKARAAARTETAPPKAAVQPKANGTATTIASQTASKAAAPQTEGTGASAKVTPKVESEDDEEDSEDEESDSDDSEEESEDESSDSDGMTATQRAAAQRKAEAAARRAQRHEEALKARRKDDLRSPICCILGHVDTGKTKLLDKIRQTNVQEGEAGGITQQIGATYFPVDAIKAKTAILNLEGKQEYNIPGLLIIDTPGHESFTNLRSRGSSLCNIAILVVDIMHGLEPQTLESLRLLRDRKAPFIVALNKIDRLYGWDSTPDGGFQATLARQKASVQREFADRSQRIMTAFAEQGLNAVLYYDNKNFGKNVSIVPTSAITGEGVPDMIMLLVNLTQQRMSDSLMYLTELEATVLEVKVIEGLGTTIDVVLSNGVLREGEKIVVCGLNGPIVTQIRALLTPQPLRELRIKSAYVHHKEVKAALGVKISAPDLEKAIAGSRLLVLGPDDDEDDLKEEVMSDLTGLLNSIDKSGKGVWVQASTLGSLEALLEFLKQSKIPVSGINIGPVHKKDVMRAAIMLERAKELACMLCFDVNVDRDAEKLAEELGLKLFKADIIYHLFDAFTAYNKEIEEAKRKDAAPQAVWPCRLKTIAAFAKRDPIILGVDIIDGSLRVGTPLCVVKVDPTTQKKDIIPLGKITSLEINHKSMEVVKKSQAGGGVAVKIEHAVYQSAKMFGRHFDDKDEIISHISRQSIDVLKSTFKTDVTTEEWLLIKNLKPRLGIQ